MLDGPFRSLAGHLPNVLDRPQPASSAEEDFSTSTLPSATVDDLDVPAQQMDDVMARASLMLEEAFDFASVQIKAARESWSSECRDLLCEQAAVSRQNFERQVSASLMTVLEPFIERKQRERVLQSFMRVVGEILDECPGATVTVVGPTADVEMVACSLGSRAVSVVTRASDGANLEATVGPTTIRADLSKWREAFAAAFSEGCDHDDRTGTDT